MKIKFFLSLFFISVFLSKSYSQDLDIDSLFFLEKRKKIRELVVLKKHENIIYLCRDIINKRKNKGKNKKKLANDYYRLGFYFKKNKQIDSAYFYYLKSNQIYLNISDSLSIANQLLKISKLESDQGLYNKSDSSAVSVLKYLKKENILYSSTYNCLAINARNKKEYKEALKWYDLAIKTSLDSIKKLRYLNNKAYVYYSMSKFNEAVLNYDKIKRNRYYDSIPLELKAKILDNHAISKFLDNQNITETDFLETQLIKQKANDNYGLIANYSYLTTYHKKKNASKALEYAYKMYDLSKKVNLSKDRIEALDKIISLENNTKIRKLAKERNRLRDSLCMAKQQSQNKFVKIIYNYKEEEKHKLKAQVGLEQQKSENVLIIFISIIVLIVFIIYLKLKHQRAKKEKVIEVYKTETRLAKKIHDELANDVYLIMNKAQDINYNNISLLPDLEKIYALTRDISHENSIIITGKQFDAFLRQLFAEFHKKSCKVFIKGLTDIYVNNFSKEKQIVVYRVLQELLVNMKKHSKATLVVINFSEEKGTILINYKDNGIGTDVLKSKKGIQNMDTRIKSINGLFSFESRNGKGFKVSIQFKK